MQLACLLVALVGIVAAQVAFWWAVAIGVIKAFRINVLLGLVSILLWQLTAFVVFFAYPERTYKLGIVFVVGILVSVSAIFLMPMEGVPSWF